MVVWRKREDNAFIHTAEKVVAEIVPEVENHTAATCGPGPFSMAGADLVSDQVQAAGFVEVTLSRNDARICIGRDLDDAVEFAMALGPAGERIRLAGAQGERLRPAVAQGLRAAMGAMVEADGVWAASSSWIITARAPV